MFLGLELAAAAVSLAAALKIGEFISDSIEETLGERSLRERSDEQR